MQNLGNGRREAGQRLQPVSGNRRRLVRQKVHLPAYANVQGSSTGLALDLSEILDITEDGACIQTASPLGKGAALTLSLDLMETESFISTTGKVVWSDEWGRHGIQFPGLPEISRQQLKQWMLTNAASTDVGRRSVDPKIPVSGPRPGRMERAAQSPEQTRAAMAASSGRPFVLERDFIRNLDPGAVSAVREARRDVEAAASTEHALQMLADHALAFTRGTGAAIAISPSANFPEMICRARAGEDAPPPGSRLQVGSGFSGECVRVGKTLHCNDSETDPRVDREGARRLGIRSMIAVPIRSEDKVTGILEVFSPSANSFGSREQTFLEQLAGLTAVALYGEPRPKAVSAQSTSSQSNDAGIGMGAATTRSAQALQPVQMPAPQFASIAATKPHAGDDSESWLTRLRPMILGVIVIGVLVALVWFFALSKTRRTSFPRTSPPINTPSQPESSISQAPSATDSLNAANISKLRQLAEGGDPNAQFDLGARYATGEDVKQNYAESIRWFTLAAEQGHVIAQATLGAYYWAGRGIPQDLSQAYFWSYIAQSGGDQASKYRVSVLASRMSEDEKAATQQRAETWLKTHNQSPKPAE